MAVIEFVENYEDLSTENGFQFKFFCDRCGNGFQSSFATNKLGMAGGLLRVAGNFVGGFIGTAGNSAYDIQRAIGGPQHDTALRNAVAEIKPLFNQCRRCGKWVCKDICWNSEKGLCKECAPVLAEEVASAQATVAREQIYRKATEGDMTRGVDVTLQTAAQCPECGAPSDGSKFCSECGASLVPRTICPGCKAEIKTNAKFCPECGGRL